MRAEITNRWVPNFVCGDIPFAIYGYYLFFIIDYYVVCGDIPLAIYGDYLFFIIYYYVVCGDIPFAIYFYYIYFNINNNNLTSNIP